MNAPVTDNESMALSIAAEPTDTNLSVQALIFDVGRMEKLFRLAEMMASSKITVPVHLRDNPGDCMAIAMQATRWGMDPYTVAQKTHVVNGALGYEAQLVNAVVKASRAIVGRFHYEYEGKGQDLECRVGAQIRGEPGLTWGPWLRNGDVTVRNSPLWKVNPAQQLGYLQVKNWARMFCPEAILGVYTDDELPTGEAPRNMGAAEVMDGNGEPQPKALTQEQFDAWVAAAKKGMQAARDHWASMGKALRSLATDEQKTQLMAIAEAAEQARTVETPATKPAPAPAPNARPTANAAADADGVIEDPFVASMNAEEQRMQQGGAT